jgi:ABC-type proline/glycine betaine transport system substrate-binding protein
VDPVIDEREHIRRILRRYAARRYAYGDIRNETVFDEENGRYLVMSQGWDERRVHGCLIHVEIIGDKIWIQRDGTEEGVANELVEAGIPKDRIVLGFWDPEARKLGEFAAA